MDFLRPGSRHKIGHAKTLSLDLQHFHICFRLDVVHRNGFRVPPLTAVRYRNIRSSASRSFNRPLFFGRWEAFGRVGCKSHLNGLPFRITREALNVWIKLPF